MADLFLARVSNSSMSSKMAAKKTPSGLVDPRDLFPTRGQYGDVLPGGLLFMGIRSLLTLICYSLLTPSTSSHSIFAKLPWAIPSKTAPIPASDFSIPGLPNRLLDSFNEVFGLSSYGTIVFLGIVLSSVEFGVYNLLWRREKLPLTGPGNAIAIAAQVSTLDLIQPLLYVYTASRNPTWSPQIFRWTPLPFIFGLGLHAWADHKKWIFRSNRRNDGKIMTSGVWGLVRHPNFLGFLIWRVALAYATGGWAWGLFLTAGFAQIFRSASVPALEVYMERKYGKAYEAVKEKVPYKMIPGIW